MGCFGICSKMETLCPVNFGTGELSIKEDENGIFDICKAVCCIDETVLKIQSVN